MFTLDPTLDLVAAFRDAGLGAATDPSLVPIPGVWVDPTVFELDTFATFRTTMRVVLVVGDTDHQRATAALLTLLATVATVIPVRSATKRTVILPDGVRRPGLEIPYSVRADLPTS